MGRYDDLEFEFDLVLKFAILYCMFSVQAENANKSLPHETSTLTISYRISQVCLQFFNTWAEYANKALQFVTAQAQADIS